MDQNRHYSTIGIHDVFLSPIEPTHLPRAYSNSIRNSGSAGETSFSSPEILGTIKSTPEDFIVRELATEKLKLEEGWQIADLRESVVTAETKPRNVDADNSKHKAEETSAGQLKSMLETEEEMGPSEALRRILNAHHSDACQRILESLQSLQNRALTELKACSENYVASEGGGNPLVVWIPPIPSDVSSLGDAVVHGGDRGSLHRCLKRAFLLLTTETVKHPDGAHPKVKVTIDDTFFPLAPSLCDPEVNMLDFCRFQRQGCPTTAQNNRKRSLDRRTKHDASDPFQFVLPLRPGLSKDDRRKIHHFISSKTRDFETGTLSEHEVTRADGTTICTAALTLRWSKSAQRNAKSRNSSPAKASCLLFVMKKRQKEHLTALELLTRALRCRQADLSTAGIKDMHAITYQFCTIRGINKERLLRANAMLHDKGIQIGSVRAVEYILRQGDLRGNRFVITVRDVKRVQIDNKNKDNVSVETFCACEKSHILARADAVRNLGFVNFFGEQRVGVPGTPEVVGVRSFDIGRAMLQRDYDKTVDLLITGRLICHGIDGTESEQVRRVRQVWKDSGGDVEETCKALPKTDSMSRERTVLQGLKRYKNSLEALKCLHFGVRTFWIHAYQSYIWNKMASERLELYGRQVVAGDLFQTSDGSVSVVTKDRLPNITLEQIVLPLPGFNMLYPDNEIGHRYKKLLADENVKLEKGAPLEATAKGGYRRLIVPMTSLEISFPEESSNIPETASTFTVSFDLPSGSYATMLLRELMVTTVTRSQNH